MYTIYRSTHASAKRAKQLVNTHGWDGAAALAAEGMIDVAWMIHQANAYMPLDRARRYHIERLFEQALTAHVLLPVATVATEHLDAVFGLTNTKEDHWRFNEEVILLVSPNDAMLTSTSVGDIITSAEGAWLVTIDGMMELSINPDIYTSKAA